MRWGMRIMGAAAVLALGLAGCGQSATPTVETGAEPDAPVETVTVPGPTETVTVYAEPTPSETATATADPCASLEGGESMAFIIVSSPAPGASVSSGFEVEGCSNTNEASYVWELLDGQGAVLAEDFGTASCGTGCVGDFSFTVDYDVADRQVGTLRVFESSPKDGSEVHVNAIPVILE